MNTRHPQPEFVLVCLYCKRKGNNFTGNEPEMNVHMANAHPKTNRKNWNKNILKKLKMSFN